MHEPALSFSCTRLNVAWRAKNLPPQQCYILLKTKMMMFSESFFPISKKAWTNDIIWWYNEAMTKGWPQYNPTMIYR